MMQLVKFTLTLFVFLPALFANQINDDQLYSGECELSTKRGTFIAIRKFQNSGTSQYLLVNSDDLSTKILSNDQANCTAVSWPDLRKKHSTKIYFRALAQAEENSDLLQDAGITHFLPTQRGIDLTIDLCPSRRPLDRNLFTDLLSELAKEEHPVPIAIAITGLWMEEHPDDLMWLLNLVDQGAIKVDWVNHTYHHRTSRTLPLRENFMLEKGTDVNFEILETEKMMIQHGLQPSVLFRFPGLVSDRTVFEKIVQFGLIPIGSDAWLAKGEWPKPGSIVLVHANGNEEIGVRDFIRLLQNERKEILSKHWLLYDLRESLEQEEDHR